MSKSDQDMMMKECNDACDEQTPTHSSAKKLKALGGANK